MIVYVSGAMTIDEDRSTSRWRGSRSARPTATSRSSHRARWFGRS